MSLYKRAIELAYADHEVREPLLRVILSAMGGGDIRLAKKVEVKGERPLTNKQRRELKKREEEEQVGRERAENRRKREEETRRHREEEARRRKSGEVYDEEASVGYEKKDDAWIAENMFSFGGVRLDPGADPYSFKHYLKQDPEKKVKEWDDVVDKKNNSLDFTGDTWNRFTGKHNKIKTVWGGVTSDDPNIRKWATKIMVQYYKFYEDFILRQLDAKAQEHTIREIVALDDADYREVLSALNDIDWTKPEAIVREKLIKAADILNEKMVKGQVFPLSGKTGRLGSQVVESMFKMKELALTSGAAVSALADYMHGDIGVDALKTAAGVTAIYGVAAFLSAVTSAVTSDGEETERQDDGSSFEKIVDYLGEYLSPESFLDNLKWAVSFTLMNEITGGVMDIGGSLLGKAGFDALTPEGAEAILSVPVDKKSLKSVLLHAVAKRTDALTHSKAAEIYNALREEVLGDTLLGVTSEMWQETVMGQLQGVLEGSLDAVEDSVVIDPGLTSKIRGVFSSVLEQEDYKRDAKTTAAVPSSINREYAGRLIEIVGDLDEAGGKSTPRERLVVIRRSHKALRSLAAEYCTRGKRQIDRSLGKSVALKGIDAVKDVAGKSIFEQAQEETQRARVQEILSRSASMDKYAKLKKKIEGFNEFEFGAVLYKLLRDTGYEEKSTEFMKENAEEITAAIKTASNSITPEQIEKHMKLAIEKRLKRGGREKSAKKELGGMMERLWNNSSIKQGELDISFT